MYKNLNINAIIIFLYYIITMADSCPTNVEAINKVNSLFENVKDGLNLANQHQINKLIIASKNWIRQGSRLERVGGMPPKRKADDEEGAPPKILAVEGEAPELVQAQAQASAPITEEERNSMLNMIAHIIAGGLIAGGGFAGVKSLCLILPYLEAYFASIHVLPQLCPSQITVPFLGREWAIPGAGMINWGIRSALSTATNAVESCMSIQNRYNIIVDQIANAYRAALLAAGFTGAAGMLGLSVLARSKLSEFYSKLQGGIYKILFKIKSQLSRAQTLEDKVEVIAKLPEGDEAIKQQVTELVEALLSDPAIVEVLKNSGKGSAGAGEGPADASEGSAGDSGEGASGTSGGRRRHRSYKKRKTNKKRKTHRKRMTRKTYRKRNRKSKKH